MFQGSGFGTGNSGTFGSSFNKPATGFGTSPAVFGSTGNSLFGSTSQPATGGLFGSSTTTPAFGQPQTTTPSFGGFSNTPGTGLFGSNQNASTSSGLFGSTQTSAFGQPKPAFGGFGNTQTTSLFGQQTTAQVQPQSTNIFGQTSGTTSTGLFGSSAGTFGMNANNNNGTGPVKFVAVTGSDTMIKNGVSQTISTRHHCITCMKEYESKSLEELRLEDYVANRKGPQQGVQPSGGLFGATPQQPLFGAGTSTSTATGTGLFGSTENKPLFGNTNTSLGFGQTNSVFGTANNSLFGKPAAPTSAFGNPTTTSTNTFAFNSPTNTNPFGSNMAQVKPFGTTQPTLFGAPSSQPTTGFGSQAPAFGSTFGTPATQATGGLFSQNKPTFGATNTPFSFGQSATTSSGTSLFGAKPTNTFNSPFGSAPTNTSSAFGTNSTFGSTNQNTSLFGNSFKPATNNFSFGPTQTTNTSLGTGSSLFGNTNKPTSLFGNTNTGTGLFGSSTFGSTNNTGFGSNTNSGLGMNMPMGSLLGGNTFSTTNSTPQTTNPWNQQILALAAMPFGDNALFKQLLPATGKTEELLKPVPGATQKNLLNGPNFKVSSNNSVKIKMKPIGSSTVLKVSLFEGLEDDPNYFQKMQMKPTIKSLSIQARGKSDNKFSPEFPTSPLLPLENLTSDKSSPRYFTPLDSLTVDSIKTTDLTDAINQSQPGSSPKEGSSNISSKAPTSSNCGEGSNTVLMQTLIQSPENTMSELGNKQASPSANTSLDNKENVEQSSSSTSSESETYEVVGCEDPHPAGITLRRVGYYTIPSMEELAKLVDSEGHCIVDNFTVGRYNYGNIFFPDSFDVSGLNLDEIVHFRHKEVTVYPDESCKAPLGEGLNRKAQVTLDRVWPLDKITRVPISDPRTLEEMDYENSLRLACAKMNTRFKEYRPHTGSWVFKVDHFSKYGLSDSDEEEPAVSDVKKLRLNSAPSHTFSPGTKELSLKRGLDGAWAAAPRNAPSATLLALDEDDQEMGDEFIKTPFDLDENYQPTQLSPTIRMAHQMGASSHKVQLMKASFYSEDVDNYHINGDFIDYNRIESMLDVEEYDQGPKLHKSFPVFRTQFNKYEETPSHLPFQPVDVEEESTVLTPSAIEVPLAPPMPLIKPNHQMLQYPDRGVVCYSQSLAAQPNVMAQCAMDLALFKGRSFRVGWARDGTLTSLTTHSVAGTMSWSLPVDQLDNVLQGRQLTDNSPAIVQRIRILPGQSQHSAISFQASVEGHLEVALENSLFSEGESCPRFAPRAGVEALHSHCSLAQQAALNQSDPFLLTSCQVWELCVALWGSLPDLDSHVLPTSHHTVMVRRQAVSDWLETVAREKLRQDLTRDSTEPNNIFALLTGHCILEACNQANSAGDQYAAMLLSQLGGTNTVRAWVEQQLTQWVETEADKLIDTDRLKLMMLVAGQPLLHTSDRVVNICDNLDWRRAFALHLWYVCSPVASVTDALLRYEAAFSDDGKPYARPPHPAHSREFESSEGRPIHDVCYHLLKLFSCKAHPLAPLLNPATHTVDPLDHRLSWLLLRTVESLGYTHVSPLTAANIHTSFASQLEAQGLWHWSVFVLLHIADLNGRAKAVLDVLGRHIDLNIDPETESFLVSNLHIPANWVHQAKANFAKAQFKYEEAAELFLKAEQWNEAHKLIIQHISAKAIINEKYEYLGGMLRQLVTHSKLISNWGQQGALLLDYLSVVQQVETLVVKQDPSVGYYLEKLQPQLSSLCARIHLLPTPTALHRLCQVEIAKRAVHLIRTLLILQRGDSAQSLGMSVSVLANLVNQLPLPEDYNKQELHELTASMVATLAR